MEQEINHSVEEIRALFPLLSTRVNGKPLVYLDNGATSQKPQELIDCISRYYTSQNANIHRGVHTLSQEATALYEESRIALQSFINARFSHEIIFTSGTTQGINLVAHSFGRRYLREGDEILISALEHHSNIVPWQIICEERSAKLRVIPMNENGELQLDKLDELLSSKTKLLALTHVSNSLGTINPIKEIIEKAHKKNVPVLVDGAQAVQHLQVDVQELDCDFYVFSGHKMFGPTGTGVLYGKEKWLNEMPPYMGGGDMIKTVTFEKTEYNDLPFKFEAGTPNIADGIAMKAAVDFINRIGYSKIQHIEEELLVEATQRLSSIEGLRIYGTSHSKAGVISFNIEGLHPYDVGTILDQQGIAVRTGHHCTQPIMDYYQIPGTVRASFSFYNSMSDIDALYNGILKAIKMLKR